MTSNINEFIARHLVGTSVEVKWETRAQTPKCESYYFGGMLFVSDWQVVPEKIIFKGWWEFDWYEEKCSCGECRKEAETLIQPLRHAPVKRSYFGDIFMVEVNRLFMEPEPYVWDAGLPSERADLFAWVSPLTKVTVQLTPSRH